MAEVMLAGGTVAAQVTGAGSGRPVLLHSLLADRTSFEGMVPALAERLTVVLPVLPGFGASPAVEGGALLAIADRMVEAVRDAPARYAGGRKPLLLGNGYGGFVALQSVVRHPGLAERLVLADSGAAFSEPGREPFRAMARGAGAKGREAVADTAMRRLFAEEVHAAHPAFVAARRACFLAMALPVFTAACGALALLDVRPALAGVTLPVLAVVGEQDQAIPPAISEELFAALPDARLVVLSGRAHVPQLQAPERFLAAVQPFLAAHA